MSAKRHIQRLVWPTTLVTVNFGLIFFRSDLRSIRRRRTDSPIHDS